VLLPRFVRVSPALDMALTVIGGHMTTKAWDYLEEKVAPAGGAATAAFAPVWSPAPSVETKSEGGGLGGAY